MVTIAEATKNYKMVEEIELQLKESGLEYWVKFDFHGEISFYRCEHCDGPTLGHSNTRCRQFAGQYTEAVV